MNSRDAKELIKQTIIDQKITSVSGLIGKVDLDPESIHDVVSWLIDDGFIIKTGENVAGITFRLSKD